MPNVKLTVNSFSLSRGTQNITASAQVASKPGVSASTAYGAYVSDSSLYGYAGGNDHKPVRFMSFDASKTWTGSTNSVAPQTNSLGSGSALDVTPAYYTVHMWLRLT